MGERQPKKPAEATPAPRPKRWRAPKPRMFDWSKYDPATTRHLGKDPMIDEMVTYRDRLPELLKDEGKYVLIKGTEVVGIFENYEEAIKQAIDRFRDAPVFIKQIAQKEIMAQFGGVIL
jgi:hypothetical protein